jgi:hypothetical protein
VLCCFVRSAGADEPARKERAESESYLRQQEVTHLLFARAENSSPARFFPELGRSVADLGEFQMLSIARWAFGPDVWLYRFVSKCVKIRPHSETFSDRPHGMLGAINVSNLWRRRFLLRAEPVSLDHM